MESRLNWVVALLPEAKVVIDAFGLKRDDEKSRYFPVYESRCGNVRLVVSGIGKVNAAAATTVLLTNSEHSSKATGWINFGIGGCGESRYGEAILAAKVTDEGNGRSWYPVPTWKKRDDLTRLQVTTVERPVEDPSRITGVVEMEASGFYPTALKRSSVELTQVVKVISDDPDHSVSDLNGEKVSQLCKDAWPDVSRWVESFREVVESESSRLADPPGFVEWLEHTRFTETQTHQLRRLLQDRAALAPGSHPVSPEGLRSKEALDQLRTELALLRGNKKPT